MRQPRVERVVELLVARATPDLDLVLDPRPLRQDRRRGPEVGPGSRFDERVGQADDPVTHQHSIGLAAPEERRPLALDDGRASGVGSGRPRLRRAARGPAAD